MSTRNSVFPIFARIQMRQFELNGSTYAKLAVLDGSSHALQVERMESQKVRRDLSTQPRICFKGLNQERIK